MVGQHEVNEALLSCLERELSWYDRGDAPMQVGGWVGMDHVDGGQGAGTWSNKGRRDAPAAAAMAPRRIFSFISCGATRLHVVGRLSRSRDAWLQVACRGGRAWTRRVGRCRWVGGGGTDTGRVTVWS